MDEKLNLELIVKEGTEFSKAPCKSERYGNWVDACIEIDKDHTATITMEKETFDILQLRK